jgi:signal transduction histidine kinase
LAVIRNAVYLLERNPSRYEEMGKVILGAVEDGVRMLDDIREQTSIEVVNLEKVEVATLIEQVIDEIPIPESIRVKTYFENVRLQLDRLRFRRVLENLVRNAVEAMSDGGELSVGCCVRSNGVLISVKDTAKGIPMD